MALYRLAALLGPLLRGKFLAIPILIALFISFVCSLLEASLLTITPSANNNAKERGLRWATRMEAYKSDIDRPLSAIVTLNTVAHAIGAAGAGAQYAQVFGDTGEAIFAGGLTPAILILTEIIPKTLGSRHAVGLAGTTFTILPVMITGLAPLMGFPRQIARLITGGATAQDLTDRRMVIYLGDAETSQVQPRALVRSGRGAVRWLLRLPLLRGAPRRCGRGSCGGLIGGGSRRRLQRRSRRV